MLFTLLNTTKDQILIEIKDKNLLRYPRPLKSSLNMRDKIKYCRDHEHTINNYYQLREKIKNLIQNNKLK